MRLNCSSFGLTVFLLALHAHAKKLFLPMHIGHFEAVAGLQRRELEYLSDFYPQPQVQLAYGRHDGEEKLDFVNMTLHAGDGLPIVLLERLDHLIEYVDCNRKSGQMALAFKSIDAFERAINAWGFVNNDEEELRFLLITNHDGCSPSDARQPHIVTDLRQDSEFLTTHLTFHEVDLSHVSDSYEMSFGTYERQPHSMAEGRNKPRDLLEDPIISHSSSPIDPVGTNEINLGGDSNTDEDSGLGFVLKKFEEGWKTLTSAWDKISQTPDALKGNDKPDALLGSGLIDGQGAYTLPEIHKPHVPEFHATTYPDGTWELSNKGSPYVVTGKTKLNDKERLLRDPEKTIQVFCTNCEFRVSMLITIKIKRENDNWLNLVAGTVTVNFSNLKAHGQVSFQRDGPNYADNDNLPGEAKLSEDADVIGSPVGDLGGIIPNIGDLGVIWAYQFGVNVGVSGSGEVAVGWNIRLIGNGLLTYDLVSNDHRLVGADLLEYDPLDIRVRKLTATANLGVHGQLSVSLGFNLFGVKLQIRVFLPLPEYQMVFKAAKSEGGICKEKGIDTGYISLRKWLIQLKMGGLWSTGGADHPVGDEPLTKDFGGQPFAIDCTACDIGVLTAEGEKLPPGTTVPGKITPPKPPAAGAKDEDKQDDTCDGSNSDGKRCPSKSSELQTGDQVGLLDESPNDTAPPGGPIASLQSPAQPDSSKPNDADGSSPDNNVDNTPGTTTPLFPQPDDQTDPTKGYTASLQPGLVTAQSSSGGSSASLQPNPPGGQSSSGDSAASLHPGPVADPLSLAGNTASLPLRPLAAQSASGDNTASLPLAGQSSPGANMASLPLPLSGLSSSDFGTGSLPPLGTLLSTDNTGSPQPVNELASLPSGLPFAA